MLKEFIEFQTRKISRNFQDFGFRITIQKSVSYFLKPLFESHSRILYRIKIDAFPQIGSADNDYGFKLVNPDDDDLICQIETMEEWLVRRVKPMLLAGAVCMVALQRDHVAAFYLANLESSVIGKLHLEITLGQRDAFGEQITVRKTHRRRGLATRLRYFLYTYLKGNGITTVYGHRTLDNIASKKSAQKYHYEDLAKMQYVRFFNFQRLRYWPLVGKIKNIDIDAAPESIMVNPKEGSGSSLLSSPFGGKIKFSISTSELVQKCS